VIFGFDFYFGIGHRMGNNSENKSYSNFLHPHESHSSMHQKMYSNCKATALTRISNTDSVLPLLGFNGTIEHSI